MFATLDPQVASAWEAEEASPGRAASEAVACCAASVASTAAPMLLLLPPAPLLCARSAAALTGCCRSAPLAAGVPSASTSASPLQHQARVLRRHRDPGLGLGWRALPVPSTHPHMHQLHCMWHSPRRHVAGCVPPLCLAQPAGGLAEARKHGVAGLQSEGVQGDELKGGCAGVKGTQGRGGGARGNRLQVPSRRASMLLRVG